MILFCGLFIAALFQLTAQQITDTTMPVHERIKILKFKIQEEIKGMKIAAGSENSRVQYADADYEELRSVKITPISKHHKHGNLKLRNLLTPSPTTEEPVVNIQRSDVAIESKMLGDSEPEKKIDFFYRRWFLNPESRNKKLKWVHCEAIITPYLMGHKKDFSNGRLLGYKDRVVQRLISLISINITLYSQEDIEAVLHQISDISIRIVNWHAMAIKLLFSTITGNRVHSFSNIKAGLKRLLSSWHLDLTNTTSILRQAKIFRPYCLDPNSGGSTKSSKNTLFTTTTPKPLDDCDSDEE